MCVCKLPICAHWERALHLKGPIPLPHLSTEQAFEFPFKRLSAFIINFFNFFHITPTS